MGGQGDASLRPHLQSKPVGPEQARYWKPVTELGEFVRKWALLLSSFAPVESCPLSRYWSSGALERFA